MSRPGLLKHLRTRGVWPAVEAELIRLGANYTVEHVGKHPIVRIVEGDVERRVPIASTPCSRGNTIRKAVCQVRRVVAGMRGGARV